MTTLTQSVTKEITWGAIADSIRGVSASPIQLNVGDIIAVTLKDGTPMKIAVAGIDTYHENEVIFAFKDIMPKEKPMNKYRTNKGGYEASDMAKYLDTELFELLPDDLQAVIKERRGHKLWLFSRKEVFGENGWYECPEDDVHIPYYQNAENRVKTRNGDTDWWWLASPSSANTTSFCHVGHSGDSNNFSASIAYGVAPGFCI